MFVCQSICVCNTRGEARIFDLLSTDFSESYMVICNIFVREWDIVYLINDSTNKMVHLGLPAMPFAITPKELKIFMQVGYDQRKR